MQFQVSKSRQLATGPCNWRRTIGPHKGSQGGNQNRMQDDDQPNMRIAHVKGLLRCVLYDHQSEASPSSPSELQP